MQSRASLPADGCFLVKPSHRRTTLGGLCDGRHRMAPAQVIDPNLTLYPPAYAPPPDSYSGPRRT
jgi:hypothetical protein